MAIAVVCAQPARPCLAQKSIAFICHTNYHVTHQECGGRPHGADMRKNIIAGMTLAASVCSWAQNSAPGPSAKQPVDAGAIIMPPKDQPPPAKPPAPVADPDTVSPPPKKAKKKQQTVSKGKRSKDSACKGSAELCKQTSPR
jgi:outer membrane biosynthesis protein TonB